MLKAIFKSELQIDKLGFDCDHIDGMVHSERQSKSNSRLYLVYRWLVAIFVTFSYAVSLHTNLCEAPFRFYFLYFSRWGLIMNALVGIYGSILVTHLHFCDDSSMTSFAKYFEQLYLILPIANVYVVCHCIWLMESNDKFYSSIVYNSNKDSEKIIRDYKMPISFKIYWSLHNIALVSSCSISISYWSDWLQHGGDPRSLDLSTILTHASNSVIMIVDLLVVAHPLRLLHVSQPIGFAISYGLFSYIYYICGGQNALGQKFIYSDMDWTKPTKPLTTLMLSFLLMCAVHFLLFWLYKLRASIQRKFFEIPELLVVT